jgi:hypothetical protein
MLLFNLLVLVLVIILSYLFKILEHKKYDTQLIFILLVFTILIVYKMLNYLYNKKENKAAIRTIAEKFNSDSQLNDFISDTLSDREKIIALQKKVKQYEDIYDTNNILNNNLENKIKYAEEALSKLSDQYIVDLERARPEGEGVQIEIDGSEEGIISKDTPDILTSKIDTDSIKNVIIKFLESIEKKYTV